VPVKIPDGVQVKVDGQKIEVKGSKGVLSRMINPEIGIEIEGDEVNLKPVIQNENTKAMWGLSRVLVQNMVTGVSEGFKKQLEIIGVGYKAEMKGKAVNLAVGHSLPILYTPRDGIAISVENQVKITIEGIDKEKVGQTAAEIRRVRPPEPYKGKGIRYLGEEIRRKAGKTAG
jgi:large subunit ribosomal protein L6